MKKTPKKRLTAKATMKHPFIKRNKPKLRASKRRLTDVLNNLRTFKY